MEWTKRRLTAPGVSLTCVRTYVCVSPYWDPEVFNSFVIHKKRKEKKLPGSRDE
jgi:hypothetical protein